MDTKKYLEMLKVNSISILEEYTERQPMSEHQTKVYESMKGRFGCKNELVKNFASAFMQFKFPHYIIVYRPGMIVVPTDNTNIHDYVIDEPVCMINDNTLRRACKKSGRQGNHLPDQIRNETRLATLEEINSFYDKISNPVLFCEHFYSTISYESLLKKFAV